MTQLLEEAVAELRTLPEDEQDRAAEQIEGIRHAMGQADKGQFASDKRPRKIFGRAL
jgi:hypothetical protein